MKSMIYQIPVERNSKPWKLFLTMLLRVLIELRNIYLLLIVITFFISWIRQPFSLLDFIIYSVLLVSSTCFLLAVHEFGHAAMAVVESKGLVQVSIRSYTRGIWQVITTDCIFATPISYLSQYRYFAGGPIAMVTIGTIFIIFMLYVSTVLGVFKANDPRVYVIAALLPVFTFVKVWWANPNGKDDFGYMKRLSRKRLSVIKEIIYIFIHLVGYVFGMFKVISYSSLLNRKPVRVRFDWDEEGSNTSIDYSSNDCTIEKSLQPTSRFSKSEDEIWALADGNKTIGEIIQCLGSNTFSTLFGMLNHGLIKLRDE